MPRARKSSGTRRAKKPHIARRAQKKKKAQDTQKIHSGMNVLDIAALHPKATDILAAYGLHCAGCAFGSFDSLESGARSHGLGEEEISSLIKDLQEVLGSAPLKTPLLTLTKGAATALQGIAKGEGKNECLLAVTTDEHGGFCMEFLDTAPSGARRFENAQVRGVALIATDNTLLRIGGATVDFREGRFKLDLTAVGTCGCGKGECTCKV